MNIFKTSTVLVLLWETGNLKPSKAQSENGGCFQGPNLKIRSIYTVVNVRRCKNPHAIHSEKDLAQQNTTIYSFTGFSNIISCLTQLELLDHFRTSADLHLACLKTLPCQAFFPPL